MQKFYMAPFRVGPGRGAKSRRNGKRKTLDWHVELIGDDPGLEQLRQRLAPYHTKVNNARLPVTLMNVAV